MTRTTLPKPIYAAAGAGDLVVEQVTRQLRKLPDTVEELRDRATTAATQAREKVAGTVADIDVKADLARVRQAARDRAAALALAAQRQANVASERSVEFYERLATFADRFDDVRKRLDGAVQAYNEAAGSFESRVLVSARRLKDLNPDTRLILHKTIVNSENVMDLIKDYDVIICPLSAQLTPNINRSAQEATGGVTQRPAPSHVDSGIRSAPAM